jgi:hypothetical protein
MTRYFFPELSDKVGKPFSRKRHRQFINTSIHFLRPLQTFSKVSDDKNYLEIIFLFACFFEDNDFSVNRRQSNIQTL